MSIPLTLEKWRVPSLRKLVLARIREMNDETPNDNGKALPSVNRIDKPIRIVPWVEDSEGMSVYKLGMFGSMVSTKQRRVDRKLGARVRGPLCQHRRRFHIKSTFKETSRRNT